MNNGLQTSQIPATETIKPKILYYGTPVILLTTVNEDETTNISPLSSSWALGDCIVLGVGVAGKAFENLQRHPECVINVPDPSLWERVERLAPYTGKNPVPEEKKQVGFSYRKDKFAVAGLTPVPGMAGKPARIGECPLQLEATVKNVRIPEHTPNFAIVETKVMQVHAHRNITLDEHHIDPGKWSPILYNFRHYFGLGEQLGRTFRSEV